MSKSHGIIIFGANGSGKTTLGRELARILNFKHIDHEDYAFEKSDIPYNNERSYDKCVGLMLADIEKSRGFVFSAVTGDFGQDIESLYDLAVYIEAPLELRIERVNQRNIDKFGERVREGGDMYEQQKKFVDFMASRPLSRIEQYTEKLTCPIIRVDGTTDYKHTAVDIAERFYAKPGEPWRVRITDLGALGFYRFTVIFARHNGKWLYARHKYRDTYETAGGHIEPGESTIDCAKRELYEETGATEFSIFPAFDYAVHTDMQFSYGQVFYADVQTLGELSESEMAEVRAFAAFPDKLTYPMILPKLYDELAKFLGRWYHGSPFELTELTVGSTITRWKELAEAFSRKPQTLSYDMVGGTINHNGQLNGFLYVIDEPIVEGVDIYKHPRTTMDDGVEWLTKRPLRLRKIGDNRYYIRGEQ